MFLNWRQFFSHATILSLFHQTLGLWNTLAGLLFLWSLCVQTKASAGFSTSKREELHTEILNCSQDMSIMTKVMKKEGNVSVKLLVLTLKNHWDVLENTLKRLKRHHLCVCFMLHGMNVSLFQERAGLLVHCLERSLCCLSIAIKLIYFSLYEFLAWRLKFLWCPLGAISNFKSLSSCFIQKHPRCGAVSEICSLMTWNRAELLIPSMLWDKSENKDKRAEWVKSVWRSKREERLSGKFCIFWQDLNFSCGNPKY